MSLDVFPDAATGGGKANEVDVTLTFTATVTVGEEQYTTTLTSTSNLKLKNPCVDPSLTFFTVNTPMRDIEYVVPFVTEPAETYCCFDEFDENGSPTNAFTLTVPGADSTLCGSRKIDIFYNGSTTAITTASSPLSIDTVSPLTLAVQTTDQGLVYTTVPITREICLADYPVITVESESDLIYKNLCDEAGTALDAANGVNNFSNVRFDGSTQFIVEDTFEATPAECSA